MQFGTVEGVGNKIKEFRLQMGGTRGILWTSEQMSDKAGAEACNILVAIIWVTFRSLFRLGSSRLEKYFNNDG